MHWVRRCLKRPWRILVIKKRNITEDVRKNRVARAGSDGAQRRRSRAREYERERTSGSQGLTLKVSHVGCERRARKEEKRSHFKLTFSEGIVR